MIHIEEKPTHQCRVKNTIWLEKRDKYQIK